MSNETAIASLKEKIDELNQQAWEARVNDSQKAFQLSEESVKLSRSIDYPKGLAEGLRSLGFGYIRLSKNNEAAPLLRESLSLFEFLNDLKGQAVIYEYLGIVERNLGNLGASLELLLKGHELVQQVDSTEIEITSLYQIGVTYKHLGNHENALDYLYAALSLAKRISFTLMEAYAINIIGSIYFDNGDYKNALDCYQQGLVIRQQSADKWGEAGSLDNIGFTYLKLNDLDKAIGFCEQSLAITHATGDKKGEANALLHLAEIYQQAYDIQQASKFSNESLEIRKLRGDKRGEIEVLLFLADLYKNNNAIEDDQLFKWLTSALKIAEEINAVDLLSKTRYSLHEYYKQKGDFKEALKNLDLHDMLEKESHKNTINQKVLNLEITHKAEEARKEAEAIRLKNEELTRLNKEIEEQKNKLIIALSELKAAQAQLIQSEKMASLGELTAGIAHEIQNPLNFINNFSDVNTELIAELKEELTKGNTELVNKIASDITSNEEKINHHGKRADAIVKSMLQHSRISSGKKELTDINALVYEYLRLAYHGLRAKDKSFNAKFETHFDPSLEKINVIAQDIGRVALNVINNAFFAVTERKQMNEKGFEPTVILSTQKNGDRIEIKVKDNGSGIPQKALDKIFQPFFTTKPTGQGTGLGLSLSYDIIKAHGGEVEVQTHEGKGTEFTIQLPLR
jgi:two-component system NtrC family sensor kinase